MVGFIEFNFILTALAALFCEVCSLSIKFSAHLPQVELKCLKYGLTSVLYNKVKGSLSKIWLNQCFV